jgi:hypothetical protein
MQFNLIKFVAAAGLAILPAGEIYMDIQGLRARHQAPATRGTTKVMREKIINRDEAMRTIKLWQDEGRDVEVRLRFSQGGTESHPGYVRVELDGRVFIAYVAYRDPYYTTVIDLSTFTAFKVLESKSAIIFAEPHEYRRTFESVIIACRKHRD